MKRGDVMFEYACHERSYGLYNILAGARQDEVAGSVGPEAGYSPVDIDDATNGSI